MKFLTLLSVKGLTFFTERSPLLGVNFPRLFTKWNYNSKLQIPKLNAVELQPGSFWSKSLLPKVGHRGHERVCGAYVIILRLRRNHGGERGRIGPFKGSIQMLYVDRRGVSTALETVQKQRTLIRVGGKRESQPEIWFEKRSQLLKRVLGTLYSNLGES